jgi:predicted ATPase
VLLLGTYRDAEVGHQHPLDLTLRELTRDRQAEEIHLARLSLPGTAELVRSRLAPETISDRLVMLVHERAQGNPFFTEELLTALVEQDALTPADRGPQSAALPRVRVPHSIRSVVGERVGRLPPASQELLLLASILGQEFDLDVVLTASDLSEAEILAALDAALAARLLEESRTGYGERFAFVHALIQQTLYEELPAHRRRRLHLRLGEALEKLRAGQPAVTARVRHAGGR